MFTILHSCFSQIHINTWFFTGSIAEVHSDEAVLAVDVFYWHRSVRILLRQASEHVPII